MTSERKCEGCAFLVIGLCLNQMTKRLTPEFNRVIDGDCGPAGRYWEPREEEK